MSSTSVQPQLSAQQQRALDMACQRMLICHTYIGSTNIQHKMRQYAYAQAPEGHHLIDIRQTYDRIQLAARVIAAIPNQGDVCAIAQRMQQSRPVLKFSQYTGCQAVAGRWTPGMLTNQITQRFMEPRVVVVSDPTADAQAIKECAKANILVIAFCDMDAPLEFVDIVIPCNNRSTESIGLMYWMLAKEILYLRGEVTEEWDVLPDMFFHRDAVEQEKLAAQQAPTSAAPEGEQAEAEVQPEAENQWQQEAVANTQDVW